MRLGLRNTAFAPNRQNLPLILDARRLQRKGLNLYLRYIDPVDGRRREKNSGAAQRRRTT